jgi:hypothetical protein
MKLSVCRLKCKRHQTHIYKGSASSAALISTASIMTSTVSTERVSGTSMAFNSKALGKILKYFFPAASLSNQHINNFSHAFINL